MRLLEAINTVVDDYNDLISNKPLLKPLKRYSCVKSALNSGFFNLSGDVVGFDFSALSAKCSGNRFKELIDEGRETSLQHTVTLLADGVGVSNGTIYCYRSGQYRSYPLTEDIMSYAGKPLNEFKALPIESLSVYKE